MIFNQTGGGGSPELQTKTVAPSTSQQLIVPDTGFDGLSQVTVTPALLETKSVTPSTSQQAITPSSGYYGMGQVNVGAVRLQSLERVGSIFRDQTFSPSSPYIGYSSVTIMAPTTACVPSVLNANNVSRVVINENRIAMALTNNALSATNYPQTIYGCTGPLLFTQNDDPDDLWTFTLSGGAYSPWGEFWGWCNVIQKVSGDSAWIATLRVRIEYSRDADAILITPLDNNLAATSWPSVLGLSDVSGFAFNGFTYTNGASDFTFFWK